MTAINAKKIKYASLGFAENSIPKEIFNLIQFANLDGGRKRVLVDYKEQNLKAGMFTCIAGWHRDTIQDSDAVHHLYITGGPTTEFKINNKIFSIPSDKWFKYTNELHRGPRVIKDCKRILLRLTETNIINPRNGFFS